MFQNNELTQSNQIFVEDYENFLSMSTYKNEIVSNEQQLVYPFFPKEELFEKENVQLKKEKQELENEIEKLKEQLKKEQEKNLESKK